MPTSFDPYHKWLGIPPKDQPPHHYRLLGIDLFEDDAEVIEAAANRQMTYIQSCASGEYVAESQQLMNEITSARIALLDPKKRGGYDDKLKKKLAAGGKLRVAASLDRAADVQPPPVDAPPPPPPPKPPLAKPEVAPPALPGSRLGLPTTPPPAPDTLAAQRKVQLGWQFPVFIFLLLLVIGGGIALWVFWPQLMGNKEASLGDGSPAVEPDAADNPTSDVAEPDDGDDQGPLVAPPDDPRNGQAIGDDGPKDGRGAITDTHPVKPPGSSNPDDAPIQPKPPRDGGGLTDTGPFPGKRPGGVDPLTEESLDDLVNRIDGQDQDSPDDRPAQPDNKTPDSVDEPNKAPVEKQAVPTNTILREARKHVIDELGSPPRETSARRKLAAKLIERVQVEDENAAVQFVLLENALEYAADARDLELAEVAITELSIRFEVDRIAKRTTLLSGFTKTLHRDDDETVAYFKRSLVEALDDAIEEMQYDQAEKLLVAAKTASKRQPKEGFDKLAASYRDEIETGLSYLDALRRAQAALEENPKDAEANLTFGRFYCVVRNDWGRAAGYLRNSDIEEVQQAAAAELTVPDKAEGQFEVAQAWSIVANKLDRRNDMSAAAKRRSRHWLMQAWGNAKGELKEKITGELKKSKVLVENTVGMQFVLVPAGEFVMGSPISEEGRGLKFTFTTTEIDGAKGVTKESKMSETQHRVRITRPFYLGVHEVTQEQFELVTKRKPEVEGTNLPVTLLDWSETKRFCQKLTLREQQAGSKVRYRLPTEAEWEYACRAGTQTVYFYGDKITTDHASFYRAKQGVMKVGSFAPNAFGLYDMHGNVWEWVADDFDKNFYDMLASRSAVAVDPRYPPQKVLRFKLLRGGGYKSPATYCRSAARRAFRHNEIRADLGFRMVMLRASE
jgi:formylglycine-generating enzyme required for sulfatase activity